MIDFPIVRSDDDDDDADEDGKKDKDSGSLSAKMQDALLKSRTVLIFGEINDKLAKATVSQLLALAALDDEAPIKVIVSSPGGHVESGDAIADTIKFIKPKVITIGSGWVASMGVIIFLAAEKENRLSLPNTRFMIHQPAGGALGRASDIEIEAREILKVRERLNQIIADRTGQKMDKVEEDTDRNFWMGPEEAIEYGIVGKIVTSASELD